MKWLQPTIFFLLHAQIVVSQTIVLEKLTVYGNTRTKSHIILRELDLKKGASFSTLLLQKDRAWLLRQDFLKRIEFQLKPGSTQNQRILFLVVQEKGTWSVSPILSNNDIFGWYAGTRLTTHNIWGRRNRIDAIFQIGSIEYYGLSYANPWWGGEFRLFTELNIYHTAFRYLFKDYPDHFDERDTGFILTLGRRISRRLHIGLRTGIEQIWVEDPALTNSGEHTDHLTQLEPFIRFDSRDWPLYPRTGVYFQAWMRWYNPSRDHQFQRKGLDLRFYSPIFQDNILAVQTSFDISQGTIPVYKRLHLGGGRAIRGYTSGELVGENSFMMSMEYRFPILYERNPLAGIHAGYAGVIFFDLATAWFQDRTLDPTMLRGCGGIGIHFIWDHFVIRAEYGNRGKGWGFINMKTGVKF